MTTLRERIAYLATEPMAWWFSTSIALAFFGFGLMFAGLWAIAAILNVVVALNFVGLTLARTQLRFIYAKTRYLDELERPEVDGLGV